MYAKPPVRKGSLERAVINLAFALLEKCGSRMKIEAAEALRTLLRVSRLGALGVALVLICSACTPGPSASSRSETEAFDLIIENGRLIDGSGNPWFDSDVGIRGKKIVAVGDLSKATATTRVDAAGRVVAPGFVDMHSHATWNYLVDSRAVSKVTQGITLEIEGEGRSVAPLNDELVNELAASYARFGVKGDWRSLDDFFRKLEANPATINFATYLGTRNVRVMAVGYEDRDATPSELEEMRRIVARAMEEGALGIYSALMYPPDRYNRTSELVEMAKVAASYGGLYQTHPRSEANAFRESLEEAFRIAREANIPVHSTHLKVAYVENWGQMPEVVRRVEAAREAGLAITADIYPYERGQASVQALLPPWAQEGGREQIVLRLADKQVRERIKQDLAAPADTWENEWLGTDGGPKGITIVDARGNQRAKPYEGMTLDEIGRKENRDPRESLLDIILAGDTSYTALITSDDDIKTAIQQPWIAFGTDGYTVAPDGPLSNGLTHPRAYGSFPRIFRKYVRELGLISLEDAVRRSTSLPAQILGIRDRGLLREGFFADIVIFDPDSITDMATYEAPHQVSKGIHTVIVNGQIVLKDGAITDARPGMVVRGPGYQPNPRKP